MVAWDLCSLHCQAHVQEVEPVTPAPSPAAVRTRRWRRRQRDGLLLATAEVPGRLVERLIDAGLLAEADAGDRVAIGQALVEFVKRASRP